MQVVFAALIAIAGTLLGSLTTFLFQRWTVARTESFTRTERLRQERMKAYSAFAGAVLDLRVKQGARWGAKRRADASPEAYAEAKAIQNQSRAAAWQALCLVRLLTDDDEALRLAGAAMELAADIHTLVTLEELDKRMGEVRQAVDRFIDRAASLVR
ncbi:hypothetical protein HCN51_56815 [Nonomuraea sp. FMUSA5-5]|uniref:Protein kilB n=1 Tax=Nonomuraea composti TaxID=2720023 RepID=A0ABX1BVP9_9ACTN|nr:hypothetical protein [Nonomuraea sp. FMUSA5-5]NJP98788.1 hypothetical protein [Nonomuraea sp. FMUSA5-5]